jgi:hypothetical protein
MNLIDLSNKATVQALTPAGGLSANYSMVSTQGILEIFRDQGWMPTDYREQRVLTPERAGKQKHCVVLSNPSIGGSTLPRIMLKNSHDGTSSLRLLSGLFERICANGLVVGASAEDIRLRHTSLTEETIQAGARRILSSLERSLSLADKMKAISLDAQQQKEYAQRVIEMVWEDGAYRIDPKHLLWNHRLDQRVPTLWNTFNTVQERVIRGGVRQRRVDGSAIRSREVKGLDRLITLNQGMWDIAEAYVNR